MEEKVEEKISFWKRILISIKDFEKYKIFAVEKLSKSFKYFFQFALIFVLIIALSFSVKYGMIINKTTNYIKNDLPEFSYKEGNLEFKDNQKIELQSNDDTKDISYKIIIDTQTENEEVAATDNNKLVTYDDSEFWLTFEDGTKVHLNYNTTLKYPSHFSAVSRTVYLDGEAYFQIAKDDKRPFRVITANGIVKQYGTSFNVNTYVAGVTKVVLVEGAISVLPNQGDEHKIHPGELAVLNGATQDVQISKVDISPYIAWNSGRFVFDNCSLETLMEVISRWYDKEIMFEDEDIKTIRFTGDLDRYGSIIPILKAIQRVTHLKMDVEGEAIIIRRE